MQKYDIAVIMMNGFLPSSVMELINCFNFIIALYVIVKMSSQESTTSSLQSVLFDFDETKDYSPIPLNEIKKQTEKCLQFGNYVDESNEYESDVSIEFDSSDSSDESDIDDELVGNEWRKISDHEINPIEFQEPVGPSHNLPDELQPIDYFSHFWSDLLIDQIVNETNR